MGRRKAAREKDITGRYLSGNYEEDRVASGQRFTPRSKHAQQNRIQRTADQREIEIDPAELEALPVGQVIQVHSLFIEVQHEQTIYLCVVRKTMMKLAQTALAVGDRVRFRPSGAIHELGLPAAVIEQVLPRRTVLTRERRGDQHPIVANADQLLIVISLLNPRTKWGLIDRMLVAAQGGGLSPIICLNKIDLADSDEGRREDVFAQAALAHYATIGASILQTSAVRGTGLDWLRAALANKSTVLAGHSGAGKSSLINSLAPGLNIRIGAVSVYTEKGRHTTTSARHYLLDLAGIRAEVIDTPGVKTFGLWNVTRENIEEFFPDVAAGTAPAWRQESYQRILESLGQ